MSVLHQLRNESFETVAGSISTGEGLRDFLSQRPEVLNVRRALETGSIVLEEIQLFVQHLLQQFRANERFADDYVLAALAVVLESFPGRFADDFLCDLSALHIREIPLAPRVARLAMRQREASVPGITWRNMLLPAPEPKEQQPTEWKPLPTSGTVAYAEAA